MISEKQRFEVLLEDIVDKLKLVAEGHQILRREIQVSREESKKDNGLTRAILTAAIEDVRDRIDGLNERIERFEKEINTIRKETKALELKMESFREKISVNNEKIDTFRQNLSDKIDDISRVFADHEIRIKRLEKRKAA